MAAFQNNNVNTATFTVDAVGNPEPVTAIGNCRIVTIREQAAAGTTNYNVRAPLMTSGPFTYVAGESFTFEAPAGLFYTDGEIVGYVETVNGSVTFSKVCQ